VNTRRTLNYKISSRSTPRNDSHFPSVFSKASDIDENNFNTNSISDNLLHNKKIPSLDNLKVDEDTLSVLSKLSYRNSGTTLLNKNLYKNFFAPKVLLFVSFYPFRCEHSKILKSIHNYYQINKNRVKKPLEKILENLILETPAPPKGIHNVEYQLFNEKYNLSQPGSNSLPMLSIEVEKLFSIFKIEQLLDIYKYLLLESKIIFFSIDKNFLSNTIESFLSLLYPLNFYYPTMTILPVDNFSMLENFESYVVGVNLKFTESFFKDYNLEIYKNVLVVDIDRRNLLFHAPSASTEMPVTSLEDLKPNAGNTSEKSNNNSSNFNDNSGLNLINLEIPKNLKIKIIEKLKNYIREIKANTSHKEDRDNFIKHVTHIFFSFMISLLVDYPKYLISTDKDFEKINSILNSQTKENFYQQLTIYELFKVEDFLSYSIHYLDRPFYKRLLETKMFFNFIYKKLFPKTNKEKLEIIHFDECVVLKNNKKIFAKSLYTPFILSRLYDIKNTYTVPKSRMFSRSEYDQLSNQENMKKAFKYGQEIYLDSQEVGIMYHIFPKLLYDNEFFVEKIEAQFLLNNIQMKTNLNDEAESINFEMISNQQLLFIYSNTNYSLGK
jgi:hypothetical protein